MYRLGKLGLPFPSSLSLLVPPLPLIDIELGDKKRRFLLVVKK